MSKKYKAAEIDKVCFLTINSGIDKATDYKSATSGEIYNF